MAKLKYRGKEVEVKDNESFIREAEKLGVIFGCEFGTCGTCEVEVVNGAENLSDPSQAETDFGLRKGHRLCCQLKIRKGEVEIKSGY